MSQFIAIVAYRCSIGGISRRSLDFQVQLHEEESEQAVRQRIESDPLHSYENSDEETVLWELAQIFSIDLFKLPTVGTEVTGFICKIEELEDLVS